MEIANEQFSFQAPKQVMQLTHDLEPLMSWLAKEEDELLVRRKVSEDWIQVLREKDLYLPEFRRIESIKTNPDWRRSPKDNLRPWGWSPSSHHTLRDLKPYCSDIFQKSPVSDWKDSYKYLHSRHASRDFLKNFISKDNSKEWITEDIISKPCTTKEEVWDEFDRWQKEYGAVVFKAPWSSSGRGLRLLQTNHITKTEKQWVETILKQQGSVMVEPWLNKTMDGSVLFEINEKAEVNYLGFTQFETKNGQYDGANLGKSGLHVKSAFDQLGLELKEALQTSFYTQNYRGFLGIDVFRYQDLQGEVRWQPCVEVNLRYTMGHITLAIQKKISDSTQGKWQIVRAKKGELFENLHQEMSVKHPFNIDDQGKWISGYLPLVPWTNEGFFAYLLLESI